MGMADTPLKAIDMTLDTESTFMGCTNCSLYEENDVVKIVTENKVDLREYRK